MRKREKGAGPEKWDSSLESEMHLAKIGKLVLSTFKK